jgi:hypothetical protein
MSFEFKGAIVARELILNHGGVEDQADSVCDAIIRHQVGDQFELCHNANLPHAQSGYIRPGREYHYDRSGIAVGNNPGQCRPVSLHSRRLGLGF